MPITFDIRENEYLAKIVRQAEEKGWQVGFQAGLALGRSEGALAQARRLLLLLLEHRFGALPAHIGETAQSSDKETVEGWSIRLLTAEKLSDLCA